MTTDYHHDNRDLLYLRLIQYGINGKILQIIRQMYHNTRSVIQLNGYLSDELPSKQGLKQGDNLSPILFITYINSLIEELNAKNIGIVCGN